MTLAPNVRILAVPISTLTLTLSPAPALTCAHARARARAYLCACTYVCAGQGEGGPSRERVRVRIFQKNTSDGSRTRVVTIARVGRLAVVNRDQKGIVLSYFFQFGMEYKVNSLVFLISLRNALVELC